jgi:hypothetical protein
MEELLKQMKMIYELMGKDEFAESIANMLWNIYCKCKEKGFSDDQAMQITLRFSKNQ